MESEKLSIRVCRLDDLQAIRAICEETATIPCCTQKQKDYLHLVYCDPYVQTQTLHCFVAVDENDVPLGYILCAPNTHAFLRVYRAQYLPNIDQLGLSFAKQGRIAQLIHIAYARRYKAHLHIDLSEKARHRGTGTALMNALKVHLSSIGVHALFLSCDAKNENAVQFYLRNGFVCKGKLPGIKILACYF